MQAKFFYMNVFTRGSCVCEYVGTEQRGHESGLGRLEDFQHAAGEERISEKTLRPSSKYNRSRSRTLALVCELHISSCTE